MWIRLGHNEFGTLISVHECNDCGSKFTVCPARESDDTAYLSCIGVGCESYDPARDVNKMFGEGVPIHKRPIPKDAVH